jgi:hypothetical protein
LVVSASPLTMETPVLLRTRTGRRAATAAGLLALTTTLATTAGPALGAPPDRAAAGKPGVVSLFPTDALTVPTPGSSPVGGWPCPSTAAARHHCGPRCGSSTSSTASTSTRASRCASGGAVDPTEGRAVITLQGPRGVRTGVDRVVWDPATSTLYAHPVEQLARARRTGCACRAGRQQAAQTSSRR